jgi:hypothetical protein
MTTALSALADVVTERRRQIEVEDWTPAHDDEHRNGELSAAAACYVLRATNNMSADPIGLSDPPAWWPWDFKWWKPKDVRSNLVRAGALILAEIERLDRMAAADGEAKS